MIEQEFKNSALHKSHSGVIYCTECQSVLGIISDIVECYAVSYLCRCETLCSAYKNSKLLSKSEKGYAFLNGKDIVCPSCNRVLLSVSDALNVTFDLKCSCGYECNRQTYFSDDRLLK